MREFVRRGFVVLWVCATLFGVIAAFALSEPSIRNADSVFFNWLACCLALLAAQYVLIGTANPLRIFRRPD